MSRKQQSEFLLQFVRFGHYLKHNDHHSPAAKGGDPKFSDIVFLSADYLSLGSK